MKTACVELGRVLATPDSLKALEESGEDRLVYLDRHQSGDWGHLNEADKQRNDRAVVEGGRIMSQYELTTGDWIWVLTNSDRSETTLLIPGQF